MSVACTTRGPQHPGMPPPLVALESTVIAHGLPSPTNLETALRLEALVRKEGAEPRTIGIIEGEPVVGLTEAQIRRLATGADVRKVSTRDLPVIAARKQDGGTTVAATLRLAHRAGIRVLATGGIGGVHRIPSASVSDGRYEAAVGLDVSADLEELARLPMVCVCAGAKAVLDLPGTLEVLETRGVTVVGYGTSRFPAFYTRETDLPVDCRCDAPEEVAEIVRARERLDVPGATLVVVPIPGEAEIPRGEIEPVIERALAEAEAQGLRSAAVTPFLLSRLGELTGEASIAANLALLENNARVAARVAVALGGT